MIALILMVWLHPFHVSVTDIVFDERSGAIQISSRIFTDDLENALRLMSGNPTFDILENPKVTDDLIGQYFAKTLKLTLDDKTQKVVYLGSEVEADAHWCYLEVTGIKPPAKVALEFDLLHELFDDQRNMVHFRGQKTRTFILDQAVREASYSFENWKN